jgi:hypothetical protein
VEKVDDYIFRIEFDKLEEKIRVLEGGTWRHKGDAVIVVQYDGLRRPSEISIENILPWVRLYDLPCAMMKEDFTRKLAGQLGHYVIMDTTYPDYMSIRVEYPYQKLCNRVCQ